jgi:hypothetical protein
MLGGREWQGIGKLQGEVTGTEKQMKTVWTSGQALNCIIREDKQKIYLSIHLKSEIYPSLNNRVLIPESQSVSQLLLKY